MFNDHVTFLNGALHIARYANVYILIYIHTYKLFFLAVLESGATLSSSLSEALCKSMNECIHSVRPFYVYLNCTEYSFINNYYLRS